MAGFSLSSLTDRILGITRNEDASVVAAGRTTDSALMEMLDGLSNGETIVGKILSSSEDSFKIITGNNITLSAKTQGGVVLKEGTNVLFEVCKSADRQVRLRPLYQNTADTNTAVYALKQAMVPVNDRSLELVARRMEYGDPIDRNSLLEAYKDVSAFEEAPVKYIVDLQQMKLPVTSNNLNQYESFMNMTNSVSEALDDISKGILSDLSDCLADSPEAFSALALDLRDCFEKLEPLEHTPCAYDISKLMEVVTEFKEQGISLPLTENLCLAGEEKIIPEKVLATILTDLSENAAAISPTPNENVVIESEDRGVIYESDVNKTPELNMTESDFDKTDASVENKTNILTSERFSEILAMPEIKEAFTRTLVSRGMIDKEKIGNKAEISRMYARLISETSLILNSISSKLPTSSETLSSIQNLQNNMDFMNALNGFVPYVQIPFNSEGGNHNGELYVFKNNRSLSSGDSELTAFLHLDMANLGPTDVFVSLKDARVTTNFTLKDEETLSFIEKNIHFLDKRLTEKGYGFKFEAKLEKQMSPPVEKMLSNKLNKIMVARTSFDARA